MKRGLSRGWFTVTTGDPERDRRGNTLLVALWLTMPAMVLTAAIFWNVPNGHLSGTVALLVGVASAVLVPVCRSGHVDIATYTYMAALLLLVVAQPVISGDLSTNALLVPPLAAFTMFLLPYDRRWLVVIWGVAAIAVLWVGTNDDDTVLAPRTTQLLTTALVSASTVIVIGLAAGELLAASRRQRELTRTLREQRGRLGEMERLANTDPLTGLFNRRALEPMSDRALPRETAREWHWSIWTASRTSTISSHTPRGTPPWPHSRGRFNRQPDRPTSCSGSAETSSWSWQRKVVLPV